MPKVRANHREQSPALCSAEVGMDRNWRSNQRVVLVRGCMQGANNSRRYDWDPKKRPQLKARRLPRIAPEIPRVVFWLFQQQPRSGKIIRLKAPTISLNAPPPFPCNGKP